MADDLLKVVDTADGGVEVLGLPVLEGEDKKDDKVILDDDKKDDVKGDRTQRTVRDDDRTDDDEDDSSTTLITGKETAEELAEKQEARKTERADRRQRQRDARERDRIELAESRRTISDLTQRVARMEGGRVQDGIADIDAGITETQAYIDRCKRVIAQATKDSDGEAVADATDKMTDAKAHLQKLAGQKQAIEDDLERRQQNRRPAPNPEVVRRATEWGRSNPWYDRKLGDRDSRLINSIDASLLAEGFNPATDEYWRELEKEVKRVLPHRVKKGREMNNDDLDDDKNKSGRGDDLDDDKNKGGNSKPRARAGGGGNGGGNRPAQSYVVSSARVQAMKDMGIWDDPTARDKQIKAYQKYDREHPAT